MSVRLIEPYQLKPKLLAWSELNVNEVDLLLTSFRSSSIYDIYKYFYFRILKQNKFNNKKL